MTTPAAFTTALAAWLATSSSDAAATLARAATSSRSPRTPMLKKTSRAPQCPDIFNTRLTEFCERNLTSAGRAQRPALTSLRNHSLWNYGRDVRAKPDHSVDALRRDQRAELNLQLRPPLDAGRPHVRDTFEQHEL